MNNYCEFLRQRNEIGKTHLSKKLDMACLQLLDLIVIAMHDNKELSVSNALALSEVGSPATIHKKLQILRDFDLVNAMFTTDKRTKVIKLTDKAQAYYAEIALAFRATQSPD
jgi:DNA-binding MarR family transcriptional regulator